jgi:hypothetical protein
MLQLFASSNEVPSNLAELKAYVQVDDDNNPAPENIASPSNKQNKTIFTGWGHDGMCLRHASNVTDFQAKLLNVVNTGNVPSIFAIFECLFPVDHVKKVMIPQMNKKLSTKITYGEFLRFIGMWFVMATTTFENRRDFFGKKPPSMFDGAPFLMGFLMSGH